jgi:hypothetical protein
VAKSLTKQNPSFNLDLQAIYLGGAPRPCSVAAKVSQPLDGQRVNLLVARPQTVEVQPKLA